MKFNVWDDDETPETEPTDGWGDDGNVHSDDWGDTTYENTENDDGHE